MGGQTSPRRFPGNRVKTQKYNVITFIPVVLFHQFKFFFNLFFLLIALSQLIPPLKVGNASLTLIYDRVHVYVLLSTVLCAVYHSYEGSMG